MRKSSLLFLLFAFSASAFCAEATEVAAADGWDQVIGVYSQIALEILSPIVMLLIVWVGTKIKSKLGAEAAVFTEQLLTTIVKKAINYADAWAKTQSGKPKGAEKLQTALDFLAVLLKQYDVPEIAKDKLIALIEAQLSRNSK